MILGIGMVWKGLCYLIVHAWKGLCYVILYKHACILGNTTNLLWLCLWACACTCKERGCIKVYSCVCVCVCVLRGLIFFFFSLVEGGGLMKCNSDMLHEYERKNMTYQVTFDKSYLIVATPCYAAKHIL